MGGEDPVGSPRPHAGSFYGGPHPARGRLTTTAHPPNTRIWWNVGAGGPGRGLQLNSTFQHAEYGVRATTIEPTQLKP